MINRKEFLSNSLKTIAAGSIGLNLSGIASDKGDYTDIAPVSKAAIHQSNFQELRRNVGLFTGRGGTIGWLDNSEALVAIDAQFPDTAEECINGLKARSSKTMDLLVNSHHHNDHTAGNGVFAGFTDHIIAHERVPEYQKAANADSETVPVTADQRFSTRWSGDFGDETLHLFHFGAAHTGGDTISFFEQAEVAHLGDLVFNRAYPYIDPRSGASVQNWVLVLNQIIEELPKETLYIFGHGHFGHGITGSWEDIQRKREFLEELLTVTQKAIAEGKSKEELAKMEMLTGFEDFAAPNWRLPLAYNLEIVYDELMGS
jgi:glyoxylase-like metal-dependent hydrolase (beta-lactamase superfamily II)